MTLIEFLTEDNKVMKIDERITKVSELFETLFQNYESEIDKPLTGITENDVNLLIEFCEAINYAPIKFNTPLWKKPFQIHYDEIIEKNEKLKQFYNQITSDKLVKYFKIGNYYESKALLEFLYFKLYDIFNDKEKFKSYFKDENKDTLEQILKINEEKKNYLYNEYKNFIEKQMNLIPPKEFDNYLLQCYP